MKPAVGLQVIGTILSLPQSTGAAEKLRAWLDGEPISWEQIASLASLHLVTPALHTALTASRLANAVPEDFVAYLGVVHGLNADRNREIRAELCRIVSILNQIGIEPVLMKGVANLVDRQYSSDGDRILHDIDLLVPEEQLPKAFQTLLAAGYEAVYPAAERRQFLGRRDHHSPPVRHPDVGIAVELHRWVHYGSNSPVIDAGETLIAAAVPFRARLFTPVQRIVNCILHSQHQHGYYREASPCLRALWDSALLGRSLTPGDRALIESHFRFTGLARFYTDFVEWGQFLFSGFPLNSAGHSPGGHRLRKTLCLGLPGYAMGEELVLRPATKFSRLLRAIDNGDMSWSQLPWEALSRLASRAWWTRTWDACLKRKRSLGL